MNNVARRMWTLFEPLHAVTYFTPEAREHFEAAGLRGFWRGYFAGRAAPLGAVGPAPIVAAFHNFAPTMIERALPDVWSRATPDAAIAARQAGAVAALRRLLSDQDEAAIAETAELLTRATSHVDVAGKVIAAANRAVPMPEEPLARLWQCTTTLREHRGDGHVAALVAWELDGCDALAWRASLDLSRDVLQPARGWTDDEWTGAVARLKARGWLDLEGRATATAAEAHRDVEAITDRIAQRPWQELGPEATQRLIALLTPLAQAAYRDIPWYNPIGLPSPVLE